MIKVIKHGEGSEMRLIGKGSGVSMVKGKS